MIKNVVVCVCITFVLLKTNVAIRFSTHDLPSELFKPLMPQTEKPLKFGNVPSSAVATNSGPAGPYYEVNENIINNNGGTKKIEGPYDIGPSIERVIQRDASNAGNAEIYKLKDTFNQPRATRPSIIPINDFNSNKGGNNLLTNEDQLLISQTLSRLGLNDATAVVISNVPQQNQPSFRSNSGANSFPNNYQYSYYYNEYRNGQYPPNNYNNRRSNPDRGTQSSHNYQNDFRARNPNANTRRF